MAMGLNFYEASLRGSSHYDLPHVLRWFTANIGIHHIHHLCSQIPYRPPARVLRDNPQLAAPGRLTLWQSLGCVRMALWDEGQRRGVSFAKSKPSWAPRARPPLSSHDKLVLISQDILSDRCRNRLERRA